MSLPAGTEKTYTNLRADGDTVWKTNGGISSVKTIGSAVRQFIADLLESVVLRKDVFVVTRHHYNSLTNTTTIKFDRDAVYFKNASLDPTDASKIALDYTNAKEGTVVRVYCAGVTEPTIDYPVDTIKRFERLETWFDNNVSPNHINIYTFMLFRIGTNVAIDVTRTQSMRQ